MAESADTIRHLEERVRKLEEENRKWMRLAGTNRLTGLPNSLMLYQIILPKELGKGGETGVSLACVLICPDGLGEINQKHGRMVGDQLLKQIADFLKQQMGADESLFHCDGANFAILMPGAVEGRAKRTATTIKNQFRETIFSAGGQKFQHLTCSAGVSALEGKFDKENIPGQVERLYQEMCDRLYKAKEAGGNQVIGSPRVS
jgi:diguanylate cyclase (GGDEF)-like protein